MTYLMPHDKDSKGIKLVVWDLDNTIWDGTLLEGDLCVISPKVLGILRDLDDRGILHSIASRSDANCAMANLERQGVDGYFLVPQIGWGAKSLSIQRIAEILNISVDAILFIDDSPFELAEAAFALPTLKTLNTADLKYIMQKYFFGDMVVSNEGSRRRQMYIDEFRRLKAESDFLGPSEAFLSSLDIVLSVRLAKSEDLARAEELTVRTNQLNSTGISYSKDELQSFLESNNFTLLVAELKDRFGDYGAIALMVLDTSKDGLWVLRLILVSCRVISRGIGTILLGYLHNKADSMGQKLEVEFRSSGRNRAMRVALMMSGFSPISSVSEDEFAFTRNGNAMPLPGWLRVDSVW